MPENYTKVAIALHWIIGVAIIIMLVMGMVMEDVPDDYKFLAYQTHKSVGLTILLLSFVRLFWRLSHRAPPLPATMAGWEITVSKITHVAFYVLMIGLPLSGWALVSASPRNIPTMWFGLFEWPKLPVLADVVDKEAVSDGFGEVHEVLANITIALLALHVGAALKHHFIAKDDILARMIPFLKRGK